MSITEFKYLYYFHHKPERYVVDHNHSYHELVYYYDGYGETTVNQKTTYKYSPGLYAIYAPNDMHNEVHYSTSTVFCIGFFVNSECGFKIHTGMYTDYHKIIWNLIKKIKQEIDHKDKYYSMFAQLYTDEIAISHHRNYSTETDIFDPLNYIYKFIDENYAQDICMQTLVELSGYSGDYFRHLFKQKTGVSPKSYIINKRIKHAKNLLLTSGMSVSEIAQTCGFGNNPQFTVIFKQHTGKSPMQYKKAARD